MVAMGAGAVVVVVIVGSDILRIYLDLDYRIGRAVVGCAALKEWSRLLGMLGGRSWDSWIAEYSESHQHPLNRLTHTFGIPMIIASLVLFVAAIVWHGVLWFAVGLFVGGWALSQLWLFWVAPLLGGVLGGVVYRWVGGDEPAPIPVTSNPPAS